MEYLTSKQLSEKWGIGQCRIIRLAREGRIKGAKQFGKSWMFPDNSQKPADGRTKNAKSNKKNDVFRFPLYVNGNEEDFIPPLSQEELLLRNAQLDFLSCDLKKAQKSFENILKNTEDNYIKISALFFLCYLSAGYREGKDFQAYYTQLRLVLSEDFSQKPEIKLFIPFLFFCLSLYSEIPKSFNIDIFYEYNPSVYPIMSILSFFKESIAETTKMIDIIIDSYEVIIYQLEASSNFYEAQLLHTLLFVSYQIKADEKAMLKHLKKAISIAYERNFIYPVADIYMYHIDIFNVILEDYPQEFSDKIRTCGQQIHNSFSSFMANNKITDMYSLLSKKEYQFVLYAVHGYSYKQVAGFMNISQRTVANRYSEIYEKLGVKNKQHLAELAFGAVEKSNLYIIFHHDVVNSEPALAPVGSLV